MRRNNQYQNNRRYDENQWDGYERREQPKWYQTPALGILFTCIMGVASFVFTLNNRVSSLEFQIQQFSKFEEEVKKEFQDLRDLAKEHADAHTKLQNQMQQIEMSLYETLRSKK